MHSALADRIRQSRQAAGLTQQKLASEVGVTRAAVTLWETGDSKTLKAEHVFKIARALGKNPEWLVTGVGPEAPDQPASLDAALDLLPDADRQMSFDFVLYRIERAAEHLVAEPSKLADYTRMIQRIKADMARRKRNDAPG